ncbi:MAG: PAS domain-containing protein [Alphaproteobacteria bacterium]|nr:PAS domain-containing protein [Alphaproteobacteria bacterium]
MGEERRADRQLLLYWEEAKGKRTLPSESDMKPGDLSDIWGSCFLIRINKDAKSREFRYSYLGKDLVDAYGDDFTGRDVYDTLVSMHTNNIVQKIWDVVSTRKPIVDEAEFVNASKVHVRYRQCIAPLASDGEEVDCLIGAMRWRGF